MTIATETYQGTHGCKPSPSQRGLWFFLIERRSGECTQIQTTGTYAEASRYAKEEAKMIGGASRIIVQP